MYRKNIILKKLNNTRDLGGMPTEDGRKIKNRKLLRSGRLNRLPIQTAKALKELGITTIIDLRIQTECDEHPDTKIDGIRYVWLPLLFTATTGITTEKSMYKTMLKESKRIKREFGTVDNYMISTYLNVLFNKQAQDGLKKFLRLVRDEEGCILWHCASGKDRAGICAMLVESLLGVPEKVIVSDYMLSQDFCRRKFVVNRLALAVAPLRFRMKKILYGLMRTKEEYLMGVIEALKRRYGGVVEYCKQVLGVTDEDVSLLKEKYLE